MNPDEAKEETMKAMGALEEATESLEETVEECEDKEEAITGFLVWLGLLLKKLVSQ